MDFFRHVFGEEKLMQAFKGYPLLLAHHEHVLGLGRMRDWRDNGRKEEFLSGPPMQNLFGLRSTERAFHAPWWERRHKESKSKLITGALHK